MCGICGFNWEDDKLVKTVCDSLKHRGPDKSGYFVSKEISLGHKRLKIIDLSEKGSNPMTNEDGTLQIVFNGEIYNFLELRERLKKKGHKFSSNTDTEVVLHDYEEKGVSCLEDFEGMFAFALWDSKKKILFLAVDHAGIKPIYYYYKNGKFIFASEIKAILEAKVEPVMDHAALASLLDNLFVTNNRTLFKDIYSLQGGHYIVYDAKSKSLNLSRYWKPEIK